MAGLAAANCRLAPSTLVMSLEHLPRIQVDFNELVEPGLVLLSKTDVARCDDGTEVVLKPGMPLVAFQYNEYKDGTTEYLFVLGSAERNDPGANGEWTRAAQWCCRYLGKVQFGKPRV